MSGATFDTTKTPLQDLLKNINTGKMQLPDFQRGWVWDDERIRSLLASIAVSFPIGAVMLLETGGPDVRFKPRPVEGVEVAPTLEPEILILDGQQRFTSLYQSLMLQKPVKTTTIQKRKIERFYYFRMPAMVNDVLDEDAAIISVPAERQIRSDFGRTVDLDLSTSELEYKNHMFPANLIFSAATWRKGYQKYWEYAADKMELYDDFEEQIIKRFEQYHLPVIQLDKSTPKEAVCLVFEKVNTGGVALNVFELLTATFAADNFQLREDWETREKALKRNHKPLEALQSDDFLQAITLLVTWSRRERAIQDGLVGERLPGISCKRRDILRLTLDEYRHWADAVTKGFEKAARFLVSQNIFRAVDVPYRTQLVPLVATLVALGNDAETVTAQKRIAHWFWCGVLGELYGGGVETRFARDLPDLLEYVRGGTPDPKTVQDANFDANRLLSLRTRNSAAYKGIHALLMRSGCRDFRTGDSISLQTFFDDNIDIHHIFPQKWCSEHGIDTGPCNSIVNKTALSARTNRIIGGHAPSHYLAQMRKDTELSETEQVTILKSHGITPEHILADQFQTFFAERGAFLVDLIEQAMGKEVAKGGAEFLAVESEEEYADGDDEWLDDGSEWMDASEPLEVDHVPETGANNGRAVQSIAPELTALEEQFHQAMITVYQKAKNELNYTASYFLQMVSEVGGLEAAHRLLAKDEISDGFTELYLRDRLDLTVEAQVVKPEYAPLFTADEIEIATRRLEELGYPINQ